MIITSFLLFSSSFLSILADNSRPKYIDDGMCTALGIGRLATSDQSTITTHNADCQECDIRVTHVPARDWPSNSKRPVFRERLAYPRLLETEENNIHGPEYLVGTIDTTIYPWEPQEPIFYVDQVEHTYAYTMGHYPLQNEKQLTMGESTCYTTFWSIPSYFPDGKANFNLRSLMEIAMERCETARCAITTMGDYAVKYGFYAIDGSGPKADSGESLSIGDKKEMWIFHINADDTHESAVWVAQRVPDDEIAVIANQYIIGEIDLSNPDYFMASSNIYDVAIRSGLWSPDSGIPFNFLHIYGLSQAGESHGMNLRVWRAMTLAAPSKSYLFNPLTDYYATFGYGPNFTEPYPFSIKPDHPLTLQEIMAIARDNYENTAFDLTENPLGGPFGDVIQTGGSSLREDPEHGLTSAELKSSAFPTRAISIWRTTYSSIAQSRESLPDEIGALTWIAQYAPHHSSYTPVYVSPHTVPSSITNTTQYKFDKTKNYWIHLLTGNYVSRWYIWTIGDVRTFQKEIEADIFHKISIIESKALKQIEAGNVAAAINLLSEFQEKTANQIVEKWWDFFHFMVSKYRDIVRVDNFHAENFAEAITWINYRRWWMELVGFWGPPGTPPQGKLTPEGVSPIAFNTQASPAEYQKVYPQGSSTKYYLHATTSPNDQVNVAPEPPVSNPIQVPVPVPSNNDIITDTPVTTEPPVVIIPDSTEAPQNQSDNDNNNNNPSTTTNTTTITTSNESEEEMLKQELKRAECIVETFRNIKIFPLVGSPNDVLKKSKFQNHFDCVFVSSRSAHFLQDPLVNEILRSSPNKSLVAVETSKYITALLRDQKKEFIEKEKEFGTLHNWTYLSTDPVPRRKRDENDTMKDTLFFLKT